MISDVEVDLKRWMQQRNHLELCTQKAERNFEKALLRQKNHLHKPPTAHPAAVKALLEGRRVVVANAASEDLRKAFADVKLVHTTVLYIEQTSETVDGEVVSEIDMDSLQRIDKLCSEQRASDCCDLDQLAELVNADGGEDTMTTFCVLERAAD